MLCVLVSEFGRVCKRIKLRLKVSKSTVKRCSRYGNEDRMHAILKGEPLDDVKWMWYTERMRGKELGERQKVS